MTNEQIKTLLRKRASKYKGTGSRGREGMGLRAWCRANNIAAGHASEFLNDKRGPMIDLLNALGLEWRVVRKRS